MKRVLTSASHEDEEDESEEEERHHKKEKKDKKKKKKSKKEESEESEEEAPKAKAVEPPKLKMQTKAPIVAAAAAPVADLINLESMPAS